MLSKEFIKMNLTGKTKDEILQEMVEVLDKGGVLNDKEEYLRVVREREITSSTGLVGVLMFFISSPISGFMVGLTKILKGMEAGSVFLALILGLMISFDMGLATMIGPKNFESTEREAGKAAFAMGLIGITEGAIPFAAADPLRVIPSIIIGSLSVLFLLYFLKPINKANI